MPEKLIPRGPREWAEACLMLVEAGAHREWEIGGNHPDTMEDGECGCILQEIVLDGGSAYVSWSNTDLPASRVTGWTESQCAAVRRAFDSKHDPSLIAALCEAGGIEPWK